MSTKRSRVTITSRQRGDLAIWLYENKDRVKTTTDRQLAELATHDIGATITEDILRLARIDRGMTKNDAERPPKKNNSSRFIAKEIVLMVDQLREQFGFKFKLSNHIQEISER